MERFKSRIPNDPRKFACLFRRRHAYTNTDARAHIRRERDLDTHAKAAAWVLVSLPAGSGRRMVRFITESFLVSITCAQIR